MIDYSANLKTALDGLGIPVHYELFLHSGLATPCISYMELSNVAAQEGNTLGYSNIQFQIKVWDCSIATIQTYACQIDETLRPLGFRRIGSAELHDNNSAMIQKILTYECLALENFS